MRVMNTPLMIAATNGHPQVCSQLLTAGAEVNGVNGGYTASALREANERDQAGCARVLEAAGGVE